MTNEQTIDRIINETFEEMGAFSKLIIIFESLKIEPAMQKKFSGFFFQSVLVCPILYCVDLVPKLTHFEKKFSKCVIFQSALYM